LHFVYGIQSLSISTLLEYLSVNVPSDWKRGGMFNDCISINLSSTDVRGYWGLVGLKSSGTKSRCTAIFQNTAHKFSWGGGGGFTQPSTFLSKAGWFAD
jgi:hypothetical protein